MVRFDRMKQVKLAQTPLVKDKFFMVLRSTPKRLHAPNSIDLYVPKQLRNAFWSYYSIYESPSCDFCIESGETFCSIVYLLNVLNLITNKSQIPSKLTVPECMVGKNRNPLLADGLLPVAACPFVMQAANGTICSSTIPSLPNPFDFQFKQSTKSLDVSFVPPKARQKIRGNTTRRGGPTVSLQPLDRWTRFVFIASLVESTLRTPVLSSINPNPKTSVESSAECDRKDNRE